MAGRWRGRGGEFCTLDNRWHRRSMCGDVVIVNLVSVLYVLHLH